jgi:hypothetical protein
VTTTHTGIACARVFKGVIYQTRLTGLEGFLCFCHHAPFHLASAYGVNDFAIGKHKHFAGGTTWRCSTGLYNNANGDCLAFFLDFRDMAVERILFHRLPLTVLEIYRVAGFSPKLGPDARKCKDRLQHAATYRQSLIRDRRTMAGISSRIYITDFQALLDLQPWLNEAAQDTLKGSADWLASNFRDHLSAGQTIADGCVGFKYTIGRRA